MTREQVYQAIDSERSYQDKQTQRSDRPDMIDDMHVGDILSAIQCNLGRAHQTWYTGATPHQETMHLLRKIAGLCVKAGETYGMPERPDPSGRVLFVNPGDSCNHNPSTHETTSSTTQENS